MIRDNSSYCPPNIGDTNFQAFDNFLKANPTFKNEKETRSYPIKRLLPAPEEQKVTVLKTKEISDNKFAITNTKKEIESEKNTNCLQNYRPQKKLKLDNLEKQVTKLKESPTELIIVEDDLLQFLNLEELDKLSNETKEKIEEPNKKLKNRIASQKSRKRSKSKLNNLEKTKEQFLETGRTIESIAEQYRIAFPNTQLVSPFIFQTRMSENQTSMSENQKVNDVDLQIEFIRQRLPYVIETIYVESVSNREDYETALNKTNERLKNMKERLEKLEAENQKLKIFNDIYTAVKK